MNGKTTDLQCDVAVIGAGTAGIVARRQAEKAGASTLLIDPEFAGTTCATVGCMPSKLLIAAADAAHCAAESELFGIDGRPRVDGRAVFKRLRAKRDAFVEATRAQLLALPDETRIRARAAFTGPTELRLDTGQHVQAKAVVIATGASPAIPSAYADLGETLLTNESIFDLTDLPASLGVIGAGALGLELAQAMARLGVEVTVLDIGETVGGIWDAEVSAELHGILSRDFPIHLGVEVRARRLNGKAELTWSGAGEGKAQVERVLVAAGRPPNLDGLDLAAAGLELDDKGVPVFDPCTMQCGDAPIFIAGDANADRPVLHEAADEGAIAGRNAATWPETGGGHRATPMAITFTRPSAAVLGRPADRDDTPCGAARYDDQGRAKVEGRNDGLVRLYADAESGRLSGAAMCLPDAEHLAHLLAWAMEAGMTVPQMLAAPFYHPTLEEGLKPALREVCQALEQARPWDRDDDHVPGD